MKVKANFLKFSTFVIKDESQIRFWEDAWLGNRSLLEQTTTVMSTTPTAPIFSTPKAAPTVVQGGSASRFPKGWNPATGYGMLPDFFILQSNAQFSPSVTQPMAPQFDPSAT